MVKSDNEAPTEPIVEATVEPIESVSEPEVMVDEAPTEAVAEAPMESSEAKKTDWSKCLNCGNQLNNEFVCESCGYDRKLLDNVYLTTAIKEGNA